jgi:hypothetical protein
MHQPIVVWGVLCDLYSKENKGYWEINTSYFVDEWDDISTSGLPLDVAKWAELDGMDEDMLVVHNDPTWPDYKSSHSFSEIADLIETYL